MISSVRDRYHFAWSADLVASAARITRNYDEESVHESDGSVRATFDAVSLVSLAPCLDRSRSLVLAARWYTLRPSSAFLQPLLGRTREQNGVLVVTRSGF